MDWADEVVEKLRDEYFMVSESYPDHAVATALRKAKADGYREGANDFAEYDWDKIEPRANAIEKGTG